MAQGEDVSAVDIGLERDVFLRTLLRELAGTLETVVGVEEASGYISVVGGVIGEQIDASYRRALRVDRLSRRQVTQALVGLKRRIQGDFYILEEHDDHLVLGNRACPFGEHVRGRPTLCMMTSNVFGVIAAQNLGYARVAVQEAIANGDPECRVVVRFTMADPVEADPAEANAREYFRVEE